jgi:phytoene dehydrogenase-like protein
VTAAPAADVLVVGAGHNGLVCAAYLARAGLDVLVLEARDSVGGCASTVDVLEGARANICSCDHTMVRSTPIADELDLASHGLEYLDVDPSGLHMTWEDRRPWFSFHDVDRTLESLSLTHPDQVTGYRRYLGAALPVARLLLDLTSAPPTVPAVTSRLADRRAAALPRLLDWSRRSAADVLRRFFTSEALLAPAGGTGPAVWGLHPETPGTGLGALGYAMRHLVPVGRPVGGSGALPAALASVIETSGGRIRTGARVDRLLVTGDRVTGVRLAGGEGIEASTVVTAVDPAAVLVDWLPHAPAALAAVARRWAARPRRDGYESKIDAVITRRPVLRHLDTGLAERLGVSDPLVPQLVIAPTIAELRANHALLAEGRVADHPVLLAAVPSALDTTLRVGSGDDAGHVLSLEALWTPYALPGGWASSGEPERWLSVYAEVLEPGFLDSVSRWRVVTPEDYESDFGMPRGYAPSFSGGPLAALVGRDRELTRYETPVPGLFLTGAGTFPGAGVWGASGRNAASVVLRRLGRSRTRAA